MVEMEVLANLLVLASLVPQGIIIWANVKDRSVPRLWLSIVSLILKLTSYIIEINIETWSSNGVGMAVSTAYLCGLMAQVTLLASERLLLWRVDQFEKKIYELMGDYDVFEYAPFVTPYSGAGEPSETEAIVYGRDPEDPTIEVVESDGIEVVTLENSDDAETVAKKPDDDAKVATEKPDDDDKVVDLEI